MREIWRKIPGYEKYEASNLGRIRSSFFAHVNGPRVLRPCKDRAGYLLVALWRNNSQKTQKVHRLVALAFKKIKKLDTKLYVNHIDGVKDNNRVTNLEAATPLENSRHAIEIGLVDKKGSKHPNAKLVEKEVLSIYKLLKETSFTHKKIGEMFGVSRATVSDLSRGKRWGHFYKEHYIEQP